MAEVAEGELLAVQGDEDRRGLNVAQDEALLLQVDQALEEVGDDLRTNA